MQKPIAEFIGTFTLVFFEYGAAVIEQMGTGPALVGMGTNPGAAAQLWLFIVSGVAGLLFKNGALAMKI